MHKNRTLKTLTRFKKAIKACFGPMHDRKSIEINLLTLSTLLTSLAADAILVKLNDFLKQFQITKNTECRFVFYHSYPDQTYCQNIYSSFLIAKI